MITVDEMKELVLYKKPFFAPYNKNDKRKGSAILLLTPNYESSKNLMNIPYMKNNNLYTSYYMEKNVAYYIQSEGVEFAACDRYIHGIYESPQNTYDRPYNKEEIIKNYGKDIYEKLMKDPAHKFRAETGIELIHKEPSKDELDRIWNNWNLMTPAQKSKSDKKSIELFGVDNKTNYINLINTYESGYMLLEYEGLKRYFFEDITGFYLHKEHDLSGRYMDEDLTCKTIDSCIKSEQIPSGKYYVYSLDNKNILHKVGYVNVISQYIDKQYTHPQYANFSYSWIDHVTELNHTPWGIEELEEFANIHSSKMKAISAKIVTQYGKEADKLIKAKDELEKISDKYSKIETESDREDFKSDIRKFYSRHMTRTDIRYLSYSEFNSIFGDDLKEAINALDKEITSRIKYFESLRDINHTSKPASQLSRIAVLKFNLIKRCTIIPESDRDRQLSEVINDLSIAVSHYEENKAKFQTANNVEKMKILSLQISQDIANLGSKMVGVGIISLSDLKSIFNVALDVASDNTDSDLIGKLDYMNDSLTYKKYSIKAYDREIETLLRTIDQLNAEKKVLSSNSNGGYKKLVETELL